MNYNFKKNLNKVYTFQFKNSFRPLPLGQIRYHKKNFLYYFNCSLKEFKKKKILDTGAGPGVHSTILAMMGADVYAADILKNNIKIIKKFKKFYKLNNLRFKIHDFRNEFKGINAFDLISCHNWIQHTSNPGDVFYKLVKNMRIGTKIYISCYLANTFRFYITWISRKILKFSDFNFLVDKIPEVFQKKFLNYKNLTHINKTNITDDFFSPYVVTVSYNELLRLATLTGLKPYTVIPKKKKYYNIDTQELKIGFIKTRNTKKQFKKIYFSHPVDEFKDSSLLIRNKCNEISKKIIKKLNCKSSVAQRVNFCLNLYKIRAQNCLKNSNIKYYILYNYLNKFNNEI
jgi:hypothetical protein